MANEAPYGYATPDGKLTGEAPEVAKAVLAKMGITQVDGVLTEFGSLIPGLKAGRFDIIAAGMYVNPQRCNEIAFSEPSYGIGQAILVPAGNPGQSMAVVKGFRRVIAQIRAALDERDLYALKSRRFEKLKGDRQHQRSLRINDQWRLIVEVRGEAPNKKIGIVGIEDYH